MSLQRGTGPAADLQVRLDCYDGEYRLSARPGRYYLGDGVATGNLLEDLDHDYLYADDAQLTVGDAQGTLQEWYYYGAAPTTESWTAWETLPGVPGATDIQWPSDQFLALTLESQPQSGTPVKITLTHVTSDAIETPLSVVQTHQVIMTEACQVKQCSDGSLVVYPAFGEHGTVLPLAAAMEDGTSVTATAVGDASYLLVEDTGRLEDTVLVTYAVTNTYALLTPTLLWLVCPALLTDEKLLIEIQYQETASPAPAWRMLVDDLHPVISGFTGGFLYLAETEPAVSTVALTSYAGIPKDDAEDTVLYVLDNATRKFSSCTVRANIKDTDSNPISFTTLVWSYRTITGPTPSSWVTMDTAHAGDYGISPVYNSSIKTDAMGISEVSFEGSWLDSVVISADAIEVRAVCGGVTSTTVLTATEEELLEPEYLQCVVARDLSVAGYPYTVAAWGEDQTGHDNWHAIDTVDFYQELNSTVTPLETEVDFSDSFPYIASLTDTTMLIPGATVYAITHDGALQSNSMVVPV